MNHIDLHMLRFAYLDNATLSYLIHPALEKPLVALEPPWKNNADSISCIPPGMYELRFEQYHAGDYMTFGLAGTNPRSLIKFHAGNFINETEGCPLVGSRVTWRTPAGAPADFAPSLSDSRFAHTQLMRALGTEDDHRLIIRNFDPLIDLLP